AMMEIDVSANEATPSSARMPRTIPAMPTGNITASPSPENASDAVCSAPAGVNTREYSDNSVPPCMSSAAPKTMVATPARSSGRQPARPMMANTAVAMPPIASMTPPKAAAASGVRELANVAFMTNPPSYDKFSAACSYGPVVMTCVATAGSGKPVAGRQRSSLGVRLSGGHGRMARPRCGSIAGCGCFAPCRDHDHAEDDEHGTHHRSSVQHLTAEEVTEDDRH